MTRRAGAAAVMALSLVVGACGTPPPNAPNGSPALRGGPSGAPNADGSPALPAAEQATYLAAAEAELGLRRKLLEDIHAAEVIGPQGAAVLAETERLETAFGEAAMAEFVAKMAFDVTAASDGDERLRVASIGPLAPPPNLADDEWSGSLFGATSFMVSMWMGFAPDLLPQAGRNQFVQETQNKTETHDSNLDGGLTEHLTLTQRLTVGVGRGRITFDVLMTSAAVITKASTGAEVARRTSTGNGHFEVNGCPDANGIGEGRYRIVNQELITTPGHISNGGASSTEASFKVIDGNDAHLVQTEVEAAVTSGVNGTTTTADGSPGEPIDWNARATFTVVIPASGAARIGGMRDSESNNATDGNRGSLTTQLVMADFYLAEAARKAEAFWRSGECIEMKTSEESKEVEPGARLTINVEPKGKFDSAPVKSPVTAAFTGKESLEPQGSPQDPPATLNFKAGRQVGDKGIIELKQIGKRGIGKKKLEFTVAAIDYKVEVVAPGLGELSGIKCDGKEGAWLLLIGARGSSGSITFTLPRGGVSAEAHVVYDLQASGASSHWDLKGPVTFVDGSPATLNFSTLRGRATVRGAGQSITTNTETGAFNSPLQSGKFCS